MNGPLRPPNGKTAPVPSMQAILGSFAWPSEAFWRQFELAALRDQSFQRPILELGCGDGSFTELAGLYIDAAIDLSQRSVDRASQRTSVYGSVRCLDMRSLRDASEGPYGTIFANSVLEHVTGLDEVLSTCATMLAPGGQLVTTVPLVHMNGHLLLRSRGYTNWRQRRLAHHNLWDVSRWSGALIGAGFAHVSAHGYLDGRSCRFWDVLDLPASFGIGRARVGVVARRVFWPRVPQMLRLRIARALAVRLEREATKNREVGTRPCAALIVATMPADDSRTQSHRA